MRQLNGYVFGHYDSRGGTSFVLANTREEAETKYFNYWWKDCGLEQEEWWEGITAFVTEDFMGPARLAVPDDFDVDKMHEQDLEGSDIKGRVLAPGSVTDIDNIEEQPDDEADFVGDVFDETKPVQLEFLPDGAKPQVLKKFCSPRWDDDAYSFLFVK